MTGESQDCRAPTELHGRVDKALRALQELLGRR